MYGHCNFEEDKKNGLSLDVIYMKPTSFGPNPKPMRPTSFFISFPHSYLIKGLEITNRECALVSRRFITTVHVAYIINKCTPWDSGQSMGKDVPCCTSLQPATECIFMRDPLCWTQTVRVADQNCDWLPR